MTEFKRKSTLTNDIRLDRVYPRGSFGAAVLPGLTSHYWPPHSHEYPVMGLPPAGQHLWGTIKVGDRVAFPIRQFQNELAIRFFLFEGEAEGDLPYHPASETGYAGICTEGTKDERWGIWQPSRKMQFAFLTNEKSARWRESEAFDFIGEPMLEALQFCIPDADEPFAYFARGWRIREGTFLGQPITDGFFFQEQVYMRPGKGWFTSKYFREMQKIWITFATEFEDGTVQFGQLKLGFNGFAFAIIQRSDGSPIVTTDVRCDIELDENGYCEHVCFDMGKGERWVWRPNGGGRMPLPDPNGPRWRDGIVTREDDTRAVRLSNGWSEVYPLRI